MPHDSIKIPRLLPPKRALAAENEFNWNNLAWDAEQLDSDLIRTSFFMFLLLFSAFYDFDVHESGWMKKKTLFMSNLSRFLSSFFGEN